MPGVPEDASKTPGHVVAVVCECVYVFLCKICTHIHTELSCTEAVNMSSVEAQLRAELNALLLGHG